MFGVVAIAGCFCLLFLYSILLPLARYLYDAKGLRKYPGYHSFVSGLTDLGYSYLASQGYRSKALYEAHKDKPILRIGPNSLSFGRTEAVKDIYGHGTKCTKDLKEDVLKGTHEHLFDVIDKPAHAQKRKRLAAAFAIKHLEAWEYKIAETTKLLLDAFDAQCTSPLPADQTIPRQEDLTLDYNKYIFLFTVEAINYLALSDRLGLLEQGSDDCTAQRPDGTTYPARYREALLSGAHVASVWVWDYDNFPWLRWVSKFSPKWRRMWNASLPWGDIVRHQTVKRLKRYQSGEKLDDFFSALLEDKAGNPYCLEFGEIYAETNAIINAGAETTAIALTQVLDLLIRHPQHLKTLREEVDAALEEDEVVAPYDKVKNLPFLRACIDEALRIIPPSSLALPRRTPPEGAYIQGEWIAGNTTVAMAIYACHRDEKVFAEPEVYNPHRWMDGEERKRMEPYFIPFSAGARGCTCS
jgi:benzoate 4-monooxygenase